MPAWARGPVCIGHLHDDHVGVVAGDDGADGIGEFGGVAVDANGPAIHAAVGDEAIGEIDLFAAGEGEIGFASVSGDADDFDPFGLGRANAGEDAFADGILIGEGLGGELLIDNHDVAVGGVIGVGKGASRDQRGADGVEVAGENDLGIDGLDICWGR